MASIRSNAVAHRYMPHNPFLIHQQRSRYWHLQRVISIARFPITSRFLKYRPPPIGLPNHNAQLPSELIAHVREHRVLQAGLLCRGQRVDGQLGREGAEGDAFGCEYNCTCAPNTDSVVATLIFLNLVDLLSILLNSV